MCPRIEELSIGSFDANKMFFSSVCCAALMFTKNVFHMFDAGFGGFVATKMIFFFRLLRCFDVH